MIQNARFSFVIPCYQSEHTIADVVRGIREAFPADGWNTEIVLVNDGSSDRTFEVIAGLARRCVAEKLPRLSWWVLNWNEPSRVFYRALGAVAQDEWTVKRLDGEALARLGAED